MYMMQQPGKRKPSYKHALATWNLDRAQFNDELGFALSAIRLYLRQHGLANLADLDAG